MLDPTTDPGEPSAANPGIRLGATEASAAAPSLDRRAQRQQGMARLIGLHDDDGSFDRDFWAAIPPAQRLEMVWDIVLEYLEWQGVDGSQSRLQKSVTRVKRGRRATGRAQDLIDVDLLERDVR